MKKILEKFMITLLIIMVLTNFIGTIPVYAATGAENALEGFFNVLTSLLGGLVGILTLPERLAAISVANVMNDFTATVAYVDNDTSATGWTFDTITPFDILFNKVKIVDVNFFDITDATGTEEGAVINKIRKGVAKWYYAMRNIAASILLCILIYVGIRMALSTIASDRAMYKKMLVDWVCSLLLIFVLQYIMLFTIYTNNAIVKAIETAVSIEIGTDDSVTTEISEAFDAIEDIANNVFDINSLAATIVYCMLIWQTLGLFISYFNRMIKIAFLIIISPLISVTYSIDKMGDGKAQALGNWLKEFIFTILMQPFHCAIYMCMVSTALNLLVDRVGWTDDKDEILAVAIVSILCIKFIKEAEKLIRKIFSFADDNNGTSLAAGMMASSMALSKAKDIGGTAKRGVTGFVNKVKNMPEAAKNTAVELAAMKAFFNKDNEKSFAEVKAEKREEFDTKQAERLERRNNKKEAKYRSTKLGKKVAAIRSAGAKARAALSTDAKAQFDRESLNNDAKKKLIDEKAKEKMDANPGMKESQARAAARLEVEKERRREMSAVRRPIDRAVGRIKSGYDKFSSYAVVNELKQIGKDKLSTGVGLMVGAGLYGTKGDIASAIMSGAATKKAVSEVFGPSKKSAVNESSTYMQKLGFKNSADISSAIDKVSENQDKYDPNTEKGKEELDKLSKFLDTLGTDSIGDVKSNISNVLKTEPNRASSSVEGLLGDLRSEYMQKNSLAEGSSEMLEFDKNAQGLMDYSNYVGINAAMKTATSDGMSIGEYKTSVISASRGKTSYNPLLANEIKDDTIIAKSLGENVDGIADRAIEVGLEEAKNDARARTNAELTRLDNAFETEIQAEEQLLETLKSNGADPSVVAELEKRKNKLIENQKDVILEGLIGGNDERKLTLVSTRLAEKYKLQIEKAIQDLVNNVETKTNKELETRLTRLQHIQSSLDRVPTPKPKKENKKNKK